MNDLASDVAARYHATPSSGALLVVLSILAVAGMALVIYLVIDFVRGRKARRELEARRREAMESWQRELHAGGPEPGQ